MEAAPKQEKLIIKTESAENGRTRIDFYFDKKLKRSVEMVLTNEFLETILKYIEQFIDTQLFCGTYDGIRFEDYQDQYKSFNLVLNPCDMNVYNRYYGTKHAEYVASATLRWLKGPEAKRPSQTNNNSTKKQLVGEIYDFIRRTNPQLKSELIESLLDADLYDYYDRIR